MSRASAQSSQQLPSDVLRDLLGMTRALYRERVAAGASEDVLELVARAGKALTQALELSKLEPDTTGHRAGWGWADKGVALLCELLTEGDVTASELLRIASSPLRAV